MVICSSSGVGVNIGEPGILSCGKLNEGVGVVPLNGFVVG
jgi:hypothetical protein